jgi:5-methylcytosine-specific restriction endonuclease McrA
MTWKEMLDDVRWDKKRNLIKEAANWRCEDCGTDQRGILQVHHTVYLPRRAPWDYDITTLMCLCKDCHPRRQGREDAYRFSLGQFTRSLPFAHLEDEVWRNLKAAQIREMQRLSGEEPEE